MSQGFPPAAPRLGELGVPACLLRSRWVKTATSLAEGSCLVQQQKGFGKVLDTRVVGEERGGSNIGPER